jgi:C1A family cysteine protease
MKTALALGFPFIFGFSVYESFESETVSRTGIVPMPSPGEKMLGGHAVLAVGYDDTTQRFLVRNSWGTSWGMKGYFTIPYAYLTDRNLSDDFWLVQS